MNLSERLRSGIVYSPDDPMGGEPTHEQVIVDIPEFKPYITPEPEAPPAWAQQIIDRQTRLEESLRTNAEDTSWMVDNEALDQRVSQKIDNSFRAISEQLQGLVAPSIAQRVVDTIGEGLNANAHAFIREQIKDLNPQALQAVLQNPQSQTLLREAAENRHRKGSSTPIPKTDSVQNPRSSDPGSLNAEEERQAQALYRGYSRSVNGYTLDMARKSIRDAKANLPDYAAQGALKAE